MVHGEELGKAPSCTAALRVFHTDDVFNDGHAMCVRLGRAHHLAFIDEQGRYDAG